MSQQQNGANAVAAHAERHAERHSERQAAKNARDRMKESNEWVRNTYKRPIINPPPTTLKDTAYIAAMKKHNNEIGKTGIKKGSEMHYDRKYNNN